MDDPSSLPFMVPQTLEGLERAVMLLGSLAKGQALTSARSSELMELLGLEFLPETRVAQDWKSQLKRLRKQLRSGENFPS